MAYGTSIGKKDVDIAEVQHRQTGPGPHGSSVVFDLQRLQK